MGVEIIRVVVGGVAYTSWEAVAVTASVKEAARSFSLKVALEGGGSATAWTFKAGAAVSIYANADLLLTGYVDRYQPRVDANRREATITGRSKAADAIDSSAEHATGRIKNKTLLDIAKELDKFGIGFTSKLSLKPIPVFQITPGETVFDALERHARSQGVALMGKPDGGIEIVKGGTQRHAGPLIEGFNFKEAGADHNWSNRHSKYTVKGQRPTGTGAENLEIEAAIKDAGVDRYRPVVIVEETDTDKGRAKDRAKNRRDRAAGNALKANVTVQGFRDDAGEVWTPNRLVWVESDTLQIMQDMLVEGVTFELDDKGGSLTRLALVDPRAYGGKTKGTNKSGKAWKQDDSEAE